MQLCDLKKSILQLSATDVMNIHREIRANRVKRKPIPAKVEKKTNHLNNILQKAEDADVDELDELIARLTAMKKGD
jgi:hypothetical protein